MTFAKTAARFAFECLFPCDCLGCECPLGPGDYGAVCASCRRSLPRPPPPLCRRCAVSISGGDLCRNCLDREPAYDAALAAFSYERLARDLVVAFKHKERLGLRRFFAAELATTYLRGLRLAGCQAVTHVPLHRRDQRLRGRNHAEEIAAALAARVGLPHLRLLTKTRRTGSQASLSRQERLTNVQAAFAFRRLKARPHGVLLVDDVITTGATVEAASLALKAGGIRRVVAIAVARTPAPEAR